MSSTVKSFVGDLALVWGVVLKVANTLHSIETKSLD